MIVLETLAAQLSLFEDGSQVIFLILLHELRKTHQDAGALFERWDDLLPIL